MNSEFLNAADIVATLDSANGSSSFVVNDSGNTAVASIDSDGNLALEGTLEVRGAGTSLITGPLDLGSTGGGARLDIEGGYGAFTDNGWSKAMELDLAKVIKWEQAADGKRYAIGATNTGIYFMYSMADDNSQPANYPFVIRASGNVGIGVTNPGDSLEVNGRIKDATGYVTPVGAVIPFGGAAAPDGWLICDGSTVSRSTYADLFAVISTNFGSGDGATTFHLPDLRGNFVRGRDGGAGNDPDRAGRTALNAGGNTGDNVGSYQADELKSHRHQVYDPNSGGGSLRMQYQWNGIAYSGYYTNYTGGNETRPRNVYLNYIIKY